MDECAFAQLCVSRDELYSSRTVSTRTPGLPGVLVPLRQALELEFLVQHFLQILDYIVGDQVSFFGGTGTRCMQIAGGRQKIGIRRKAVVIRNFLQALFQKVLFMDKFRSKVHHGRGLHDGGVLQFPAREFDFIENLGQQVG